MLRVAQGGTVRLPAVFRNSASALVDPVDPVLEIMDANGATVASGLVPTRESIGEYHYDWTAPSDAGVGTWIARFTGTIDGLLAAGDEAFLVTEPGYLGGASLITLPEYKAMMGVQAGNNRDDSQITGLLPAASRAVKTFTGRNFDVSNGATSVRTFQYDGEQMLDIDDATTVVSLSTDAGVAGQSYDLSVDQWTAMPQDDSDVFYYVLLHGGPYLGMSPEMGFERNLDRIGINVKQPLISVTAVWGWPAIPEDVKLATALTVKGLLTSGGGNRDEALTAEAIEGWSRSWGGRAGMAQALTIPNKARDLLVNYQRIFV